MKPTKEQLKKVMSHLGKKRMAKMTKKERTEFSRKSANVRWGNDKKELST